MIDDLTQGRKSKTIMRVVQKKKMNEERERVSQSPNVDDGRHANPIYLSLSFSHSLYKYRQSSATSFGRNSLERQNKKYLNSDAKNYGSTNP